MVVPAKGGPYDLGTVVVRNALAVDPASAQASATSDPLPQILKGIPIDLRKIALDLDRPEFTLNPTSCEPMAILGQGSRRWARALRSRSASRPEHARRCPSTRA